MMVSYIMVESFHELVTISRQEQRVSVDRVHKIK